MSSKNVVDLRKAAQQKVARAEVVERRREAPPQDPRMVFARRGAEARARRRKRLAIIALLAVVLIAAAAYGISWASYLPKYSITQVTVTGTQQIPEEVVYDYIESQLNISGHPFISPDNVLRFNAGALERKIVGYFPRIASAQVSRTSLLATAITVTVTERQPFALWCTDDTQSDCYYMDQQGFIFAQAPANPAASAEISTSTSATSTAQSAPVSNQSGMYVFEGAVATSSSPIGQSFVSAHLPGILAFLQMLGQAGVTPTGANVQSDSDFYVPLTQGFYLKASFGEDPQQLVQNLQLVLSSASLQNNLSSLEYVDLRFGDRVYYKLKGQDQTQAPSSSQ